jgi:hypothetical protein
MPRRNAASDAEYHLLRARSERNAAYRLGDAIGADSHMRLSALHLERALILEEIDRTIGSNSSRPKRQRVPR